MEVWVLVTYCHPDCMFFGSVHTTREGARDTLFGFVEENWDNECIGTDVGDGTTQEDIDLFFESMEDDFSYFLESKTIQGILQIQEEEEPGEIFLTEEELRIASVGLQHVDVVKMSQETGETPAVVEDKVIEVAKKLG